MKTQTIRTPAVLSTAIVSSIRRMSASLQASFRALQHPADRVGATEAISLEHSVILGEKRGLNARRRQSSRATSTRALDGGVGLESRSHPVSPFDGVFVACRPF
jgi:hypothetical protein